jgi:acetoin utilization protein AcuB
MSDTTIRFYMTPMPHTIGADQTLSTAHRLLKQHHIRHLPVLKAGHVVGILSDRDLSFVETLKDVDPERLAVEEAMTPDPYTVEPEAPLAKVVAEMAEHRFGAALVVEHGHVIGIFTAVDGLRVLAERLA